MRSGAGLIDPPSPAPRWVGAGLRGDKYFKRRLAGREQSLDLADHLSKGLVAHDFPDRLQGILESGNGDGEGQ
jgi:hypothetical protein